MYPELKSKEQLQEMLVGQSTESLKQIIEISKKHASDINRMICYANRELKNRRKRIQ